MSVTHYSVYRSGHYKAVKSAVDIATELNDINVSKRYYSNKQDESENKTFHHYLVDELIEKLGSDYYYRAEIVEVFNPVKSQLHKALEADQIVTEGANIRSYEHLFEINVDFQDVRYPERLKSFEDMSDLLDYLRTFPTIDYLFKYEHVEQSKALGYLTKKFDRH